MGKCIDDVNKPATDESQIECCGIYPTNCVVASSADPFLKTRKGETLSIIISKISDNLKKLFQKFNDLDRYFEFSAVFDQVGTDGVTFVGQKSTFAASISSVRNSIGDYDIIFSQSVLTEGTIVIISLKNFPTYHTYSIIGENTINIKSYDSLGNLADNLLTNEFIHIKTPKNV